MIGTKPLAATFGAEVLGVDLGSDAVAGQAAELRAALHRHQVLLFRGGCSGPDDQLRITELFGRVTPPWTTSHAHPADPRIEVFQESPPRAHRRPSEHWHSDASFLELPTEVTVLHALTAPEQGGQTAFTDTRAALAGLPAALRARVGRLTAVHDFGSRFSALREKTARVSTEGAVRERAGFPPVRHPLVREHPVTGEPALYLNELCLDHVEGLTPAESGRLLTELYERTLRPRWQYAHRWQVGDVLVWDNPSLLHRGHQVPAGQHRLLHRTTAEYRERRP
ncbi:TauD/TfdA family dioxygenase [Streptomyces sp. CB03911]|uniref:TauD/TfdA dioxygenase family protein n=1 Tax=Streptomyces sp. CB03911 TaxID=1804758 RepID=UPI00093A7BB2|nr:TauD/TfdA family dioxygenase [Streptomyces sp. CB03911]OKI26150.1 hypothetical protein A6A07_29660 [Streptomyces sp. CB03911]